MVSVSFFPGRARAAPVAVRLQPKESRCIWTEVLAGEKAEVSVFVQSGGKLDVRLEVRGPYKLDADAGGAPVVWDDTVATVRDAVVRSAAPERADAKIFASPTKYAFKPDEGGAFRACVENSVSRYEDKLVLLEWRSVSGAPADDDRLPIALTRDASQDAKDAGVAALAKKVVSLRRDLALLRDKQARERRRLAHHKAINDASHVKIVEGSLVETAVYVVISAFQIIFVRRWFQGKGVSTVFGSDNV